MQASSSPVCHPPSPGDPSVIHYVYEIVHIYAFSPLFFFVQMLTIEFCFFSFYINVSWKLVYVSTLKASSFVF